jgi:hypothetical protein
MLRLLYLQREVRRSVRVRHREAAALLARTSVETCLIGLFCLASPEAAPRLHAAGMRLVAKLIRPVADAGEVPEDLFAAFFSDQADAKYLPKIYDVAAKTVELTGQPLALELYRRLYDPLSMLFAHAGPLSLMRHVDPKDVVRTAPMRPWTGIAALRASDACVGILASALADARGISNEVLVAYANDHWTRTPIPLLMVLGQAARGSIQWSALPGALFGIRDMSAYYRSGQAHQDPPDIREERTRRAATRFFESIGGSVDPDQIDALVEALVAALGDPSVLKRPGSERE